MGINNLSYVTKWAKRMRRAGSVKTLHPHPSPKKILEIALTDKGVPWFPSESIFVATIRTLWPENHVTLLLKKEDKKINPKFKPEF